MHSPLSNQPAQKVRDLPKEFLREELGKYFGAAPAPEVVEADYSLWRCAETGLEFADPPLPGNASFYAWISSFSRYYPGIRWEYGQVGKIIQSSGEPVAKDLRVLDVGSGNGDFLRSLEFLPAEQKSALDFNASAIENCRKLGFQAFGGTIEEALAAGFLQPGSFPFVTSFHCLEHVPDPVGFVRDLLKVTTPGGKVFLSTPLSPMSFESEWFDVMNHPPHHMLRWNLPAYEKLAGLFGVQMRYFAPGISVWRQTLQTFGLQRYGASHQPGRKTMIRDWLLSLPQLWRIRGVLQRRAERHGLGGSDLILVELTAPHLS